jgi:hypothetical protein
VLLLAAIPPLAGYIGTTQVGWQVVSREVQKLTPESALWIAILSYLTILVAVFFIGKMIHWMGQTYGAKQSLPQCIALAAYTASLWRDSNRRRARAFAAALLLGLAALTISALRFRMGPWLGPGTVLAPLAFLAGALTLGAVATGMLLGHWYLIDLGLSIEPLQRVFRFFVAALVAQLVVGVATVLILGTTTEGAAALAALWRDSRPLLLTRLVLGPVAALGVAWLIHRTLRIPQTMAATGLFYIAILAVLVGEMLGRLILLRTSLPL